MEVAAVEMTDTFTQKLHQFLNKNGRYVHGTHRFGPTGCVLASPYVDHVHEVKDFEVREDDVWLLTFPKSGTTWTQELLWLLVNDLDWDRALSESLDKRSPYIEASCFTKKGEHGPFGPRPNTMTCAAELPSPRVLKSHLPVELLPDQLWTKNPKIIHVTREPKDVALSYFHHHRLMDGYNGSDDLFYEAFLHDYVEYSPYWDHVLGLWKKRDQPNYFFVTYEDMKKDLPAVIRRLAEFLNKSVTDEQVERLAEHLDIKSMRENSLVNNIERISKLKAEGKAPNDKELLFIRKGVAGEGKKAIPPERVAEFDSWTTEHIAGTDYPWPHTS